MIDNIMSKILEFIYSKDKKIERYLIVLLISGFILRLISSLNLNVLADDMLYASQSAGILDAKIISTHSNPPLLFYLTDVAYSIFGYTTFASRFFPLIAGTLTILLVFLITQKFFGKKKALFTAFFVTFSSFLIRNTFTEMSNVWLFFIFFGVYLGIIFLERDKMIFLIMSGISFGLAFLTKYNAPFYIISFLLFSIFYLKSKNKKILTKKNAINFLIFAFIIVLFSLPFLTFNYLIYKDKGILDVYFSRIIQTENTQQIYGSLAGQEFSFFDNLFLAENYLQLYLMPRADPIIFILALAGIFLLFKRKNNLPLIFFFLFLLIPFVLQSAGSHLGKHFVFMPFLFSIMAGYGLHYSLKILKRKEMKILLMILILSFLIYNLGNSYHTPSFFLEPSPTSQIKSYIINNVEKNDLIVLDPRIYTARSFWIATPYHHLNAIEFVDFTNQHLQLPPEAKIPITVYIVECATDDCGWGIIKNQPGFNVTVESIFTQLTSGLTSAKTINSKKFEGNEIFSTKTEFPEYRIYKRKILLNPTAVEQVDSLHNFYFTPYLYKDMTDYLYNYEIKSLPDRLLDSFSYFIIWLSIILSVIFLLSSIYFAFSNKWKNKIQ